MKPPLIVRPAVARLRAEVRGPKALAKVGRHRLGLDDDNGGTLGSQGCGELLGELFGGVCMYRSASESGCDGDNVEARQIHSRDAGALLQQCERLEDGVLAWQ